MTFSQELAYNDFCSSNSLEYCMNNIQYYSNNINNFSAEEYEEAVVNYSKLKGEFKEIKSQVGDRYNPDAGGIGRFIDKKADKARLIKYMQKHNKKGLSQSEINAEANKFINQQYNKQRYGRKEVTNWDRLRYHGGKVGGTVAGIAVRAKDKLSDAVLKARAALGSQSAKDTLRGRQMMAPINALWNAANKNGVGRRIINGIGEGIANKVERWAASEEQQQSNNSEFTNYSVIPTPNETAEYQQKQISDQISKQVINAASFSEQHKKNLEYTEVINSAWDSLLSYGNS